MAGEDDDQVVTQDFSPSLRIYKSGRIERLIGTATVPPSVDPITGVSSKDVNLFPYDADVTAPIDVVSARLFLPKLTDPLKKLPILIYFHGGIFLIQTPFSPVCHNYLTSLVASGNFVAVSVHYRLAPEHPLPIAYEDSWSALKWVLSHASGSGPEPWLTDHGDFDKVTVAGDSAGANITHQMAIKAGEEGIQLSAIVLVHPYFVNNEGSDRVEKLWRLACPSTSGLGDPLINPVAAGPARLGKIGVGRMLVCVAEKDYFRPFGLEYYREMRSSGWGGVVEMLETEGEEHVFHLFRPESEKAAELRKRLVEVINGAPARNGVFDLKYRVRVGEWRVAV